MRRRKAKGSSAHSALGARRTICFGRRIAADATTQQTGRQALDQRRSPRDASGRRRARSYQTPIRKALSRDSQGRASGPLGAALDAAITQGE